MPKQTKWTNSVPFHDWLNWLNKLSLKDNTVSYTLCLYVADPATFLASDSVPGPYFSLRTSCLFRHGKNNISQFVLSPHKYCSLYFSSKTTQCPFNVSALYCSRRIHTVQSVTARTATLIISKKHYNIWYCIWGSAAFPKYKVNGKLNHSPSCSTASCQSHSALKSYKVKLANHRTSIRRVWYDSKRLEKKPRRQNEDRHHSQESHSPGDITTEGGRRLKKHHIPELSLTHSLTHTLSLCLQALCRMHRGTSEARRRRGGFHRALMRLAVHRRRGVHFD